MLVFEIKQKYEDIKFMMKDTWIKLISLENELGKLKCAKIPLICYGDKGEKLTFSNDQASVIDLMKHFGYNTQRPSWQSHLAAQPRVELDKPTLKKFGKNVIKCSQLTTGSDQRAIKYISKIKFIISTSNSKTMNPEFFRILFH